MKNQKRGQVALFIIIGLIILIAAALVIYFVQVREVKPIEREAVTPPVPIAEADPISTFVTSCLKITAIEGMKLMGDQGGYVTPAFMVNPMEPTEAEAVQLGRKGLVIPYWWHMSSPNTCQNECKFDSKRPDLYSGGRVNIEDQLRAYVEMNIRSCLNNFKALRDQGYTIDDRSSPEAEVRIRENDIFLELDWKVTAAKGDTRYDVSKYATTVDLDIKEIYDVATELTNLEINRAILGAAVKELIFAFSSRDENSLPPVSDMTFDLGGGMYWTKTDVAKKTQQMLQAYIPALQVTGTRNFNYVAAPAGVRDPEMFELIYNRGFLIPLEGEHPDLEVKFYYLNWWKPYFDLNCDGEICQPDNMGMFLLFSFAMQKYNFVYDISLPIMIEINDPEAINGLGYSFKFMLEANMRNNEVFASETILPPTAEAEVISIFCNPNQRTSGDIILDITDYATGDKIQDASITYTCGEDACMIGRTGTTEFKTKFPRCMNGILTIQKLGYQTINIPVSMSDIGLRMEIKMYPEKTLKVEGRKYLVKKEGWNWRPDMSAFYPVEATDELLISFNKEKKVFEAGHTAIIDLSKGQAATVDLVPGTYKITFTGFSTKETILPKDRRCTPPVMFLIFEVEEPRCFYMPEEDMTFNAENPLPTTMSEIEFEIKPEQLYKAQEIILPYFALALDQVPQEDRKIEDLDQISRVKSYTTARENMLKPILR